MSHETSSDNVAHEPVLAPATRSRDGHDEHGLQEIKLGVVVLAAAKLHGVANGGNRTALVAYHAIYQGETVGPDGQPSAARFRAVREEAVTFDDEFGRQQRCGVTVEVLVARKVPC